MCVEHSLLNTRTAAESQRCWLSTDADGGFEAFLYPNLFIRRDGPVMTATRFLPRMHHETEMVIDHYGPTTDSDAEAVREAAEKILSEGP